ncbi:SNF2-related protein [Macrophomina phaseolina MS6]|uniref:SNF2-related protein n=1 Tax=Macrophomina phaseolina (strain MS6) TaxID=1126212 RepID=K2S7T0_MACPH|nr:SNF2-related protein [Macrophomina phaseolina MS6]
MDRPKVRVGSPMPMTPKAQRQSTYVDLLKAFGAKRSPSSLTQSRKSATRSAHNHLPRGPSASPDPLSIHQPLAGPRVRIGKKTPETPSSTDMLDTSSTIASSVDDTPKRVLRPRRNRPDVDYTETPREDRSARRNRRENKKILLSDMLDAAPKKASAAKNQTNATARTQIRSDIALNTKVKRDAFLYRHSEFFLPLLPPTNYIAKLNRQNHGAFVSYRDLEEQPKGVTATLKPYQLSGLSFLAHMNDNGMPCMLGDEMGLGKTLQTLSLFQLLEERQKSKSAENRPYLVVCPLSVVNSWVTEAHRWTPKLKVLRFHGPKIERDNLKKVATGHMDRYGNETARSRRRTGDRRRASNKIINLGDEEEDDVYKIVVTSYETFFAEQSWFKTAFVWRYIVLDEGHKIKNHSTHISQALQNIRAEFRLILTGTPLQNDLHEMWALLHWLLPDVFTENTADLFKSSFDLSKGQVDTSVMDNARQLLELLMLRRMKNSPGVNLNLPQKEEVLLYVPLTPLQRFWYLRLLTRSGDALLEDLFAGVKVKEKDALRQDLAEEEKIKALEEVEARVSTEQQPDADVWGETRAIMKQSLEIERQEQKKSDWTKLMNLVMQLRKCCSHPYLLPGVQPEPYLLGDHVIRASGKFIVLEKLIRDLVLNRKKKVIIFSGFKDTLNLCEDLLNMIGQHGESFRYLRFDGATERARRNLDIRLFNDTSTNYMTMLVSTRAGGLGINLTAATEAIFLDEDWNPQITLQAEARAHRIGQTKPVTIYKLCTQGTVEEQMMGRIRKKLYLSAKITESMKSIHGTPTTTKKGRPSNDEKPHLDVSQLKSLLRRGAQTLTHPEIDVTDMLSWDLDTVLEKCRDKPSDSQVADDSSLDEQKWLSSMEKVETAVFAGQRFQRNLDAENNGAVGLSLTRNDRRKGKNTTVMIDGYAVSKQSLNCEEWEAVPTLAGKDPRLADPVKEKKKAIINQDHCQTCWDGGELWICSLCPRSYHEDCLNTEQRAFHKLRTQFCCPQHMCADCSKKTTEAGGMLYRCRFCALAFCEDCLNFDRATLIGPSLPEFEILDYGEVNQAFFIKCHVCADIHDAEPEMKEYCDEQVEEFERALEEHIAKQHALEQIAERKASSAASSRKPSTVDLEDDQSVLPPEFHGLPLQRPGLTRISPRSKKTHDTLSNTSSRASSNFSLDLTDATTVNTGLNTTLSTPREMSSSSGYFAPKNVTGQLRFGTLSGPRPVATPGSVQSAPGGSGRKRRAVNTPEVANGIGNPNLEREKRPKQQKRMQEPWFPEWV